MLFGEYVTTIWWPAWKPPTPLHPRHQEQAHRPDPPPLRRPPPRPARRPRHRRLAARHDPRGPVPPHDRDLPVAAWHHLQRRRRRRPLGPLPPHRLWPPTPTRRSHHPGETIPAAHDLAHPPAGRPARRRHRLPLPRLIVLAAHTGARWSELTALCWIDVRTNYPLDDGAITGPGQLRIPPPATTSPSAEDEPASPPSARPRSRPSRRTIALDPDTIAASARTANSSADVPATWSSPAPAAPAAPAANSHPPTSRASGSAPCPPPGWTRPGPTRSGHTSTTCATPTPSGCSPSRPPSARSPGGWATPTPWSPCACTSTPRPWSRRTSSPRAPSASPPIAGPADPPPMTGGSAALRRTQAAGRPEGWCWRPDWTTGPTGVHNAGDAVAQRYDTTFSAPGPAFPGPCALRESAPPW